MPQALSCGWRWATPWSSGQPPTHTLPSRATGVGTRSGARTPGRTVWQWRSGLDFSPTAPGPGDPALWTTFREITTEREDEVYKCDGLTVLWGQQVLGPKA